MRITFVTRKFGNVERNSHCDVLHITPIIVARLFLDCNGDFAIKPMEAVMSSTVHSFNVYCYAAAYQSRRIFPNSRADYSL